MGWVLGGDEYGHDQLTARRGAERTRDLFEEAQDDSGSEEDVEGEGVLVFENGEEDRDAPFVVSVCGVWWDGVRGVREMAGRNGQTGVEKERVAGSHFHDVDGEECIGGVYVQLSH